MDKDKGLVLQIESDLGLNSPFIKGQIIAIRRCWHFSTDGNAVDVIFYDEQDFIDGMNRIYVVLKKYDVIILAFVLMDTHVHFILYGELKDCNSFVHDYISRTSRHIMMRHGENKKMKRVPINYQAIDNDRYLKIAICYVVKNPPVAGLPYMSWNYPWSSGPLYFNKGKSWTSATRSSNAPISRLGAREWRSTMKTKIMTEDTPDLFNGMVLPQEFVDKDLVERIFKTTRSYNYFLCITREEDVESHGGSISRLSIPIQEMRQYRSELCQSMFGTNTIRSLNTQQRLKLAKVLRNRYNSSLKQVTRMCGLVHDEVKGLIE